MKKFLSLIISLSVAITAAGQLTETRTVSNFSSIDASSAFDITLTKGTAESLVLTADEDIMPYVRSEVRNGILKLYLDEPIRNVKNLKAAITMKDLKSIDLSGRCKLRSDDVFTSEKFDVDLSGVSSLQLKIKTGQLSFNASGASETTIHAVVRDKITFKLSGATQLQGTLTSDHLSMDISGRGEVNITGAARATSFKMSGTSKIKADNFIVKNVTVKSSGASSMDIHVTESLKVRSSGVSVIRYKGNPATFDTENGGASTLKKIK
jgi:hypothetical protein